MNDMDRILSGRLNLDVDEWDRQPAPVRAPEPSIDELIARLHDVGSAVAGPECDLQPPTRMRHLATIDAVVARLRKGL